MNDRLHKIEGLSSSADNPDEFFPWRYGAVYERQQYDGGVRLRVGTDERQVDLLIALMEAMREPLFVLYVLNTPVSAGYEVGRYQSEPVSREEAGVFLALHERFLESDAWHSCWIAHPGDGPLEQVVYEHDNLLYAYGPVDEFETILRRQGYVPGKIRYPDPHCHRYHPQLNCMADEMMAYWRWIRFPLQAADGR